MCLLANWLTAARAKMTGSAFLSIGYALRRSEHVLSRKLASNSAFNDKKRGAGDINPLGTAFLSYGVWGAAPCLRATFALLPYFRRKKS